MTDDFVNYIRHKDKLVNSLLFKKNTNVLVWVQFHNKDKNLDLISAISAHISKCNILASCTKKGFIFTPNQISQTQSNKTKVHLKNAKTQWCYHTNFLFYF